ncbi:MAG: hypothetical protein JO345_38795 [Streptosporangiaceae bacterium]|nr:hypothetical protein [Streptosporangiaceae bacterium]
MSDLGFEPEFRHLTGNSGNMAAVIDFLQFSAAPRLGEMLCGHGSDVQIYDFDPLADLEKSSNYVDLNILALAYATAFREKLAPGQRASLVGYCSTAALTMLVAGALASDYDISAVLVQPSWPDNRMIASELTKYRTVFGAEIDPDIDIESDPLAVLGFIDQVYTAALEKSSDHNSAEHAEYMSDFVARHRSWLWFLVATRNALLVPCAQKLPTHVIMGKEGSGWMPWLALCPYTVVRLTSQNDNLFDDSLATVILSHVIGKGDSDDESLSPLRADPR